MFDVSMAYNRLSDLVGAMVDGELLRLMSHLLNLSFSKWTYAVIINFSWYGR